MEGETVKSQEDLFAKMRDQRSDSMDFVITREPQPGRTFSQEALESLNTTFLTFVGARIAQRFSTRAMTDPGVSSLRVKVTLELDGESITVPDDEYPWYVIGGDARVNGTKP